MKFVTAGGVFLAVPHVAGLAVHQPTARLSPVTSMTPRASTTWCTTTSPRRQSLSDLHATPAHRQAEPTVLSGTRERSSRYHRTSEILLEGTKGKGRKRPWWAVMRQASSTATMTRMAASPQISERRTGGDSDMHDSSSSSSSSSSSRLRLAIVGANAGELGSRIGERYGLSVRSMDELMEGKRGRRTENVKAKAVLGWLEEEDVTAGGILTGFPTTAAEADSLEKQGVDFGQLVVVDHTLGENPSSSDGDYLMTRYEGKSIKIADEENFDKLCDSAARFLTFAGELGHADAGDGGAVTGGTAADLPLPVGVESREQGRQRVSSKAHVGEAAASGSIAAAPEQANDTTVTSSEGYDDSLSARMGTMSPSERAAAKDRDPAAYEAAANAALASTEAKRAAKGVTRDKKRKANKAQQMDTPFYVAVAQGQPKPRFRPPVPTIPSRITERLSSAVAAPESDDSGPANTRLEFGPLVLDSPASDCLLAARITEPTGIQQAGMGPIRNGESVVLHAMTGSGKTLAFLLPLMQRWTPSLFSPASALARSGTAAEGPDGGFQVLLALPTRELAVQVAREVVLLAGGVTASVELLVDSNVYHNLEAVTAPIVVGSAKVLERIIRKSRPAAREAVLSRVKCIVVDEVDRLVDVLSKNASPREVEKRKRHSRPIVALMERVIQAQPGVQVVACSATIGRPLRRELGHIVRRSSALGSAASGEGNGFDARNHDGVGGGSRELRIIRDQLGAVSAETLAKERAVAIPETIRHYCVPVRDGQFYSRLEALTAAVRELQPRRPLIFVPPDARVTAVVAHLRRSGGEIGRRAIALHEAMGFGTDEEEEGERGVGGVRGLHTSAAIQQHDNVAGQFGGGSVSAAMGDMDLLTGSGVGERLGEGETGALLVTGEDSARGLHFDDVDFVFLMQRPKSPDEYVHLAGRTGRQGKTGSVVLLVPFEEFRQLQTWSTTLKVHFEPLDILNVARESTASSS